MVYAVTIDGHKFGFYDTGAYVTALCRRKRAIISVGHSFGIRVAPLMTATCFTGPLLS